MLIWLGQGSGALLAQIQPDTTALYRVSTSDGNEFTGYIISQDSSRLILHTEKLGALTFDNKDIVQLIYINPAKLKKGSYWFDNPQSTRYLWSPNGYGLKKGEGYYQNIWVLFNQVSVGVTNNFSISAGLVPLFLFSGSPTPAWIAPKLSIPVKKDRFNLGAGALFATVLGAERTSFGILYGLATVGSRDRNVSLGMGYGYSGSTWAKSPTFNLSSLIRIGPRGYFITENYFIGNVEENVLLLSAAFRWVIKKAGLDFGFILPVSSVNEFVFIPWLGITIPFGKT
jgi:hypothetical protein